MKLTLTPIGGAAGLLCALLFGLADLAAAAPPSAAMGCLIEAERTTDVGSPVVGVIERIEVDRGQVVRRGQILAVLRANVERATLNVASSRADSDAEYKAAAASAKFNRERLIRAEDLFQQQFISEQALQQTRTESRLADHKLAQAQEQREVSQQEREVAAAQLSQRVIRSPMDGVVAERYVSAGERVDDKPLLRIARVDPLRVQLVVPISMYGHVQQSGQASVMPELPGATARVARVTMIDKVVDPASNTFRVQLELPNADRSLPAGLRCKAEFGVQALAPAAPPVAPPLAKPPLQPAAQPPAPSAVSARPSATPAAAAMPVVVPPAAAAPAQPTPAPSTRAPGGARALASAKPATPPGLKLTPLLDAEPVLASGPEDASAVVVSGRVRRVALRPRPAAPVTTITTRVEALPTQPAPEPEPAPAPSRVSSDATQTALVAEPGTR